VKSFGAIDCRTCVTYLRVHSMGTYIHKMSFAITYVCISLRSFTAMACQIFRLFSQVNNYNWMNAHIIVFIAQVILLPSNRRLSSHPG